MHYKRLYLAVLTVTLALAGWVPAQADVVRSQSSDENIMVRVSNESWQPENFVNGTTIPAT